MCQLTMIPFFTSFLSSYTRCFCLALMLWSTCPAWAQYNTPQNRIWIFGSKAGLDFTSGSPVPVMSAIDAAVAGGTLEANASVCNGSGLLQFYTDGSQVWDRLGNLMPNGVDLTGLGQGSTNSTSQGVLIVPMPDSLSKYYVFSLTAVDQVAAIRGRLFYSVVDMTLNGGLGDVINGRKGIPVDSGLTEKMIGITGDRCNIWVLTCVRGQALYKAYEITAAGLNTTPVTSPAASAKNLSFGYLAVSPDRRHIAASEESLFGGNNGLELARFDAATGAVYDAVQLEPQQGYYGISFSPDNSKLYGSSFQQVFQFDLNAADIAGTKTLITGNGRNTAMQLGPDGRIYFEHSPIQNNKISYIRLPNLAGTACQPVIDAITLLQNTSMNFGLHNEVPVFSRDTLYTTSSKTAGCFAASELLQASDTAGWGYEWSTGATGYALTATAPGLYWLRYHTPPCIFRTDTFRLSFPNGVLPQIGLRDGCKGQHNGRAWAYTYSGDTVAYHYTWKNAAGDTLSQSDTLSQAVAGSYTLQVRTAHCDTTLSFTLSEEEHLVAFTADTLICLGTNIIFQNTSDSHFTSFAWSFGDNTGSLLVNPAHLYTGPGSFTVMLAGAGAVCRDTAYLLIAVDSPVTDMRFTMDRTAICTGEHILFTPQEDSTVQSLYWQLGAGHYLTTGDEPVQHAYESAGIFPVQMKAIFRACPAVDAYDTVHVYGLPHVDLGPDSVLCLQGQPLLLSNRTPSTPGQQYAWSNGDTTATLKVVHEGVYSLKVTEAHGCTAAASVTINKSCYIDVPNAFTPNGDGSNDYFFPRQLLSSRLSGFHMQVWNRWGQVVFETINTEGRGWDGRFNGKEQPEGVYLYRIAAVIDNAHTETYQGNVTLIR